MSKANDRQVGGTHYKVGGEEHWDRVHRLGLDYFQGQITKYVERWKSKGRVSDLEKARHFLDKYIELQGEQSSRLTSDEVAQRVKPSGWEEYVYEGTDSQGALFTCRVCRLAFRCPHGSYPGYAHVCGAEPTKGYVNQD